MGLYTNGNKISPVVLKTQIIEKEVVKENDVTFYDYDGSILYSYTASDFLKLEQLPPNPPAKTNIEVPLTPQGWNWDYSDAIDYVQTNGKLDIGQSYVPTDGATHIIIEIDNEDALPYRYTLRFKPSVATGVTIDWGDNITTTSSSTNATRYTHNYANIGTYNIKIIVNNGTIDFAGDSNNNMCCYKLNNTSRDTASYHGIKRVTKRIYFGNNILAGTIGAYCLSLMQLTLVTIPSGITTLGNYCFNTNKTLPFFICPLTLNTIGNNAFAYNTNLNKIILSSNLNSIGSSTFVECGYLNTIFFTKKIINIPASAFDGCNSLFKIFLLKINTIQNYSFQKCLNLYKVIIPATITSIGGYAFATCINLKEIYILSTTPPTLGNTASIYKFTDLKIYVPYSEDHSILNAYKSATNWSSYANYLFEGEP